MKAFRRLGALLSLCALLAIAITAQARNLPGGQLADTPATARSAPAPRVAQLAPDTADLSLADGYLAMLRDPDGQLSLADVERLQAAGRFHTLRGNPALGFSADALWLSVTVARPPGVAADWLLEVEPSFLDDVRLYQYRPNGIVEAQLAGDRLPLAQRLNHKSSLFRLTLAEGENRLLLRVQTSSTLAAIPHLWSPAALDAAGQRTLLLHGAYFGLMLAVVLFNLVNGLITRRGICFLYAAYAFASALNWWAINGFLTQFWLPQSPQMANLLLPLCITLNTLLAAIFYYVILDIRAFPRIRLFYQAFVLLSVATGLSALFGRYPQFAPWLFIGALLWIPASLSPLLATWRSGRADARFAAFAYVSFAVLATINILTLLGITGASMWTMTWAGQISNLAHILLLHVSVMLGLRRADADKRRAAILAAEASRDAQRQREDAAEKGRFLSMITHEIRTPIAVIAAASESLRVIDTDTSPQRIERYDKISRAVQRMTQLIDVLLNRHAAGVDHPGSASLTLAPVDLVSLTEEILSQYAEERDRLRLTAPPLHPLARADARHLRFALINLIDNALKYSPPGTPIDIRVAPHEEPGLPPEVEWRISNLGERIPASERERLFDKHVRLGEAAGKPGLGLGLYLARDIVHRHGGRLFVDPQFASGVSFVAWLPTDYGGLSSSAGARRTADRPAGGAAAGRPGGRSAPRPAGATSSRHTEPAQN